MNLKLCLKRLIVRLPNKKVGSKSALRISVEGERVQVLSTILNLIMKLVRMIT